MTLAQLWHTIKSVLAAFIGVQSEENRKKDFTSGRFAHFILVGIAVVICFILLLVALVKTILAFT